MLEDVLLRHFDSYLQMEPQDAVKLIYQKAFGSEHMIKDPGKSLAALTVTLFEDALVDFAFENSALTYTAENFTLPLNMQQDYHLRPTLTAGGESVTLVCVSYLTEGLFPEEEAAGE